MERKHKKKGKPWSDDFPNGKLVKDYGDYTTWSNRRWAWEFLRRHPEYIQICKELRPNMRSPRGPLFGKAKIAAQEFGRVNLKHYMEPYGDDDKSRNWIAESVVDWDIGDERNPKSEYELMDGQVSMVFDISRMNVTGTAAVAAMLEHAREILIEASEKYNARGLIGPKLTEAKKSRTVAARARRPERDIETRLTWLRVFDALEIHGVETVKAAKEFVAPSSDENDLDEIDLSEKKKKVLSAYRVKARTYVNRDYLSLVPLDYIQDKSKPSTST